MFYDYTVNRIMVSLPRIKVVLVHTFRTFSVSRLLSVLVLVWYPFAEIYERISASPVDSPLNAVLFRILGRQKGEFVPAKRVEDSGPSILRYLSS